ncbi:MAG: SDR family oxidoreductase [Sneathiella sp.]|nr:SDR family oxidoreductase [Sneathiella sp.]
MTKQKHALVTGGGSGVGADIALKLAAEGMLVTITGRRAEKLSLVADKHPNIYGMAADVADYVQMQAMVKDAAIARGDFSIVVANAGMAESVPFHKMTSDQWSKTLDINLSGVFNTYQVTLGSMKKAGWGRMIAIASTAGLKGYSYVSSYCAAKHGVIGLTKSLALEVAKTGITVNAICPGFTETPMLEKSIAKIMGETGMSIEEARAALSRGNPMNRFIQPDEISDTVLWLCKNASSSITGQAISISGGEI